MAASSDGLVVRLVEFDDAGVCTIVGGSPDDHNHGERVLGFASADVLLDASGTMTPALVRTGRYRALRAEGVAILSVIDDLSPLQFPHLCMPEEVEATAALVEDICAFATIAIFFSRDAERTFAEGLSRSATISAVVTVVLGTGTRAAGASLAPDADIPDRLAMAPFVFISDAPGSREISTVVRKAMKVVCRSRTDTQLVVVGEPPRGIARIGVALRDYFYFGRRIHRVRPSSQSLVRLLHLRAIVALFVSDGRTRAAEVVESLSAGAVTVTSAHPAHYESARGYADYVHYNTPGEIAETVLAYLGSPALVAARRDQIREGFSFPNDSAVAETVIEIVRNLERAAEIASRPMPDRLQWVFISNRPESLERTIRSIEAHVPWVREYVVIAPGRLREACVSIESQHPIVFIDEIQLIGKDADAFARTDHVGKNWLLRSRLASLTIIDDEFIMLDDDNQPLEDLSLDVFYGSGPRYNGYYFFDLLLWPHRKTEYDHGIERTALGLLDAGLELLAYSSHQPQLINKSLFAEACATGERASGIGSVEEWSLYFNWLASRYPTLLSRRVFQALSWPGGPWEWRAQFPPDGYLFENYYPESYVDGSRAGLRPGMPNDEKIGRAALANAAFERTEELFAASEKYLSGLDMVHGSMVFEANGGMLIVAGVPHLVTIGEAAPLHLSLTFALLGAPANSGEPGSETQFCYRVVGTPITCGISVEARSTQAGWVPNGLIELEFPGAPLAPGSYDLEFYARFDGKDVSVPHASRRSKLVVCDAEGTVPAVYADL